MQNNKPTRLLFPFLCVLLASSVSTSFAQDGNQTVEALLSAENKAVAEKLRLQKELLAPAKVTSTKKTASSMSASFKVNSVYGTTNKLKADLSYDGKTFIGATTGSAVGPCSVSEIRGACVTLKLSVLDAAMAQSKTLKSDTDQKTSKKTSRTVSKKKSDSIQTANACSSTCWAPPAPVFMPSSGFPSSGQDANRPKFGPPVLTGGGSGFGQLPSYQAAGQLKLSPSLATPTN